MNLSDTHLANLKDDLVSTVEKLPMVLPSFRLDICWSDSYDDLFRAAGTITDESAVIGKAFKAGRVLLAGRGGGGKTQLLLRIMRNAANEGHIAILIRLQDWRAADDDGWQRATKVNIADGAGFLVERFGVPTTTIAIMDWLPPSVMKLILVDGLNELPAPRGMQILRALEELTRNQIGTAAIVTDRLARRDLPKPVRWDLGLVLPLSNEQINSFRPDGSSPDASQLLNSPFFLNEALRGASVSGSNVQAHNLYFRSHVGLDDNQLSQAGRAAFRAYESTRTRNFSYSQFIELAGSVVAQKLADAGALLASEDTAHFSHHLLHDFLAARFVAAMDGQQWTPDVFDTITMQGSSFDGVALIFEQLTGGRADQLLRSLYDWNLYATGYVLAEAINGQLAPSAEMQVMIYAMLAEKRFDPIVSTRQRATDALLLISSSVASALVAAPTFKEVCRIVSDVRSDSNWFIQWRDLFVVREERELRSADVDMLCSADSVIGWTMANVARRLTLPATVRRRLIHALANADRAIRWRIVHVLGAFPSQPNFRILTNRFDRDEYNLVHYGALRSLVEMAARTGDESLRRGIERALIKRIRRINETPRLKLELSRALIVDAAIAPLDWRQFILRIAREFYLLSDDPADKDQWRIYAAESESTYPPAADSTIRTADESTISVDSEVDHIAPDVARLRGLHSVLWKGAGQSAYALDTQHELLQRYSSSIPRMQDALNNLDVRLQRARTTKERLTTLEDWLQRANLRLLLRDN